ncbi:MAG: carbohydrate ABC transporter permease [Clostridiales bacterium]|nr:carbohydrate ABC transporter permease [Clostridiales bacterium]
MARTVKLKKRKDPLEIIAFIILTLFGLIIAVPFYNVLIVSITGQAEYLRAGGLLLFPKEPTLDSFSRLFQNKLLWTGYRATLSVVAVGLPLNVLLTFCMAYGLSRKGWPGRKIVFTLVLITMIFNGGIVPMYLLMKDLKLLDSWWSVILAGGLNTFYVIITKNFIDSLPESLIESAHLDGANEWTVLFKIVMPLSKPILATIVLFYAVDRWNEWYNSMIFLTTPTKFTLQLVLRNIVINSEMQGAAASSGNVTASAATFSMGIKMCAVIMTMLPIMCVYPFLQKHFAKGIMLGAIKA